MFSIKEEFDELVKNNWIDSCDINKYLSDENINNCIKNCTSPAKENIFNALKLIPFEKVKVVIIGQDPYPNPNHAHGLAFSSRDKNTPESLKNIFRAIDSVYGSNLYNNAYNELTGWAKQGVLLLNTGLTFQKFENELLDKKESDKWQQTIQKEHLKIWKPFVNAVVRKILTVKNRPVVMFLWGNAAHEMVFRNIPDKTFKSAMHSREPVIVPNSSVMLLQTSHPSPLSVNRGGDFPETMKKHLKECDNYLNDNKIDWLKLV